MALGPVEGPRVLCVTEQDKSLVSHFLLDREARVFRSLI